MWQVGKMEYSILLILLAGLSLYLACSLVIVKAENALLKDHVKNSIDVLKELEEAQAEIIEVLK